MDPVILLFLLQDGLTNGAIYALLAFALVLVFAVTRVIFLPQGEFVAWGALTYATLATGAMPATVPLVFCVAGLATLLDLYADRAVLTPYRVGLILASRLGLPLIGSGLIFMTLGIVRPPLFDLALTVLVVAPLGPALYSIAYRPMADASVLTLLIASVAVHIAMTGLGLLFFGAEGLRGPALTDMSFDLGPLTVTGQSIAVFASAGVLVAGLALFFGLTLRGKALRATAINSLGARLVGIRTAGSGGLAFGLAAAIGAVSGVLIVPVTTVYYDSGFLIGLKGFVAAIVGGLGSYLVAGLAALCVGFAEAYASFEISNFKEVVVFTLIIPVLIWRSLSHGGGDEEDRA